MKDGTTERLANSPRSARNEEMKKLGTDINIAVFFGQNYDAKLPEGAVGAVIHVVGAKVNPSRF